MGPSSGSQVTNVHFAESVTSNVIPAIAMAVARSHRAVGNLRRTKADRYPVISGADPNANTVPIEIPVSRIAAKKAPANNAIPAAAHTQT